MSYNGVIMRGNPAYILILIPIICAVFQIEYWPFTKYPMYTWAKQENGFPAYALALIDSEGKIHIWPQQLDVSLPNKKIFSYRVSIAYRKKNLEFVNTYFEKIHKETSGNIDREQFSSLAIVKMYFSEFNTSKKDLKNEIAIKRDL